MRNDVIKLITKSVVGASVTENQTEVFAEKKAVTYREFYAAQQVGLNPRLVFIVDLDDYKSAIVSSEETTAVQEPTEIIYDGRRYVIVRVYEASRTIELTVSNMI